MIASMTDPRAGTGEAAARARTQRRWARIAAIACGGALIGAVTAAVEGRGARMLEGGTVPPLFAIVGSLAMLVMLSIGSWRYYREMDEVQRLDNLMAGAAGANVLLVGYPIWLLLWKGGLAPEPVHWIMVLAVVAAVSLTAIWRKFS